MKYTMKIPDEITMKIYDEIPEVEGVGVRQK
jgi:hypothetical protein